MNWRRFIFGLSMLFTLIGAALVCFVDGGLLNTGYYGHVFLGHALHILGFISLIIGAVGIITVWSLKKPNS